MPPSERLLTPVSRPVTDTSTKVEVGKQGTALEWVVKGLERVELAQRDHEKWTRSEMAKMDDRLDKISEEQARQGGVLTGLVAAEEERDGERRAQGELLRKIDTALATRAAVEADRAALPTPTPPGPITAALGLSPRRDSRSTGLVAGGGLSLAAVLGLLTQLAALPVALQWALALVAAAAAITACVVVGVRMVRRD